MKRDHLLIFVFALSTIVNGYVTLQLSNKIDTIEDRAIDAPHSVDLSSQNTLSSLVSGPNGGYYHPTHRPNATTPGERREISRQTQSRYLNEDPKMAAMRLDALMHRSARNIETETRNITWLQSTLETISADRNLPSASYSQTSCVGNRCIVSAEFKNIADARNWSSRFLLTGGGKELTHSSSIMSPTLNGTGTRLQLYLY